MSSTVKRQVALLLAIIVALGGTLIAADIATADSGRDHARHAHLKKAHHKKAHHKGHHKGKRAGHGYPQLPPPVPAAQTWAGKLTTVQKQCLADKARDTLATIPAGQLNMMTLQGHLGDLDAALTACGLSMPTDAEQMQLMSNAMQWYSGLTRAQKTCLMGQLDAIRTAGIKPTDDLMAKAKAAFGSCGVSAPLGLW